MTSNPRNLRRISIRLTAVVGALLLLATIPGSLATEASATVQNELPTVTSVSLYDADPSASVTGTTCPVATTSFSPSPASTRTIYVCAVLGDANGWEDVCNSGSATDSVKFTAYAPDGTTALAGNHPRTDVALTCGTGSGTAVTATGNFVMEYWRPTAGTEADPSAGYLVSATVTDVQSATGSGSQRFYYSSLKSIATVSAIGFGAIAPGGSSSQASTIANQGNAAFALNVTGAAFTSSTGSIAANQVAYGPTSAAETGSLGATGVVAIASVPAATSDAGYSESLHLKLNVPAGSAQYIPSGSYGATLTFTAE